MRVTEMMLMMEGSGILVPFERTTDGLERGGFVSGNFMVR